MVCWRDPKSHEQQGLTVATEAEAQTLGELKLRGIKAKIYLP